MLVLNHTNMSTQPVKRVVVSKKRDAFQHMEEERSQEDLAREYLIELERYLAAVKWQA